MNKRDESAAPKGAVNEKVGSPMRDFPDIPSQFWRLEFSYVLSEIFDYIIAESLDTLSDSVLQKLAGEIPPKPPHSGSLLCCILGYMDTDEERFGRIRKRLRTLQERHKYLQLLFESADLTVLQRTLARVDFLLHVVRTYQRMCQLLAEAAEQYLRD